MELFGAEQLGRLATLGIVKGKAFNPDARMQRIFDQGAKLGAAMCRAIFYAAREKDIRYWLERHWENMFLYNTTFERDGVADIGSRTLWHYQAIVVSPNLIMVLPFLASADERPSDNMQFVVEKIRADKKLFIAGNMQLTEAGAKAFWPIYEQYQNELFLLRARTLIVINDYAKAYQKMTNDRAKNLLDEVITIDTLKLKLRQAYLPKFRKVLPDIEVVRYYQIENKINAALMYEFAAKIPLIKNTQ